MDTPSSPRSHSHDSTEHVHDANHADHTGAPDHTEHTNDAGYWDERYSEREQVWSGRPNAALVKETQPLQPGRALDLGCGEGADAIWLAQQGWQVTAVDVSEVALARGKQHAHNADVNERITWEQRDLSVAFPTGDYDLVAAMFLHSSTGRLQRDSVLRQAANAVAPGGVLLIIGHGEQPDEMRHHDVHLPTAGEVVDSLALNAAEWEVLVATEYEQTQIQADGEEATRIDNTVKALRHPSSH